MKEKIFNINVKTPVAKSKTHRITYKFGSRNYAYLQSIIIFHCLKKTIKFLVFYEVTIIVV